jgi:hypothetical protein
MPRVDGFIRLWYTYKQVGFIPVHRFLWLVRADYVWMFGMVDI